MVSDPPAESALHPHLESDERLEWSVVARDDGAASDPALPSGASAYRLGRTESAHVLVDSAGEFRRLPDRKVSSAGVARSGRPRSWTVASVGLSLCLLVAGYAYTASGWGYLFRLAGWATLLGVGLGLAHRQWLPRRVYRIETDGKERLDLRVPQGADRYLAGDASEDDDERSFARVDGDGFEKRDRRKLLLGSDRSTAVRGVAFATFAVALWWTLVLWRHPFIVRPGEWNAPSIGIILAGTCAAAVAFRTDGGLVSALFGPLAVAFGVREYSCLVVSAFHPINVLCPGTGIAEALSMALPLWVLGVGLAVLADSAVRGTKSARERLSRP